MSYNIDTWKTKKIINFSIPTSCFLEPLGPYDVKLKTDGVHVIGDSARFKLHGIIDKLDIIVDKIEDYGEGSGSHHDRLLEILKLSKGDLEAVLIWEGGDSITRLVVHDGQVNENEIEL